MKNVVLKKLTNFFTILGLLLNGFFSPITLAQENELKVPELKGSQYPLKIKELTNPNNTKKQWTDEEIIELGYVPGEVVVQFDKLVNIASISHLITI
ncbi:hypothetical protein IPJ72_00435 [Candidatus Peregrinibacteria bacterium]|nr:MAG: hypothetical protein IPJ72_00435 [Candidatus Peregrinibacteria bacterium]